MVGSLERWAAERGYRVAWGPVEVVRSAVAEVAARRSAGELDDAFFRTALEGVVTGTGGPVGGTVVVVAQPRPAHRVGFELDGERFEALLPPTYLRYRPNFEQVRQDLAAHGLPGAGVEHVTAPLKAVAARLGLVRYGRNNIAYAEGLGSYLQLCGYVTDATLPAPARGALEEPTLLPECEGCDACAAACPTGAISDGRVLLRGERCLTLANEGPGEWPDWTPRRRHNSLLGCLLCQRCCPANPRLPVEDSGVVFSADETRTLLEGSGAADQAESGIRAKLAWLGQPSAEGVLGRNLRALVESRRGPRKTAD
jgi:epoxyqueuosine reductase